MSPRTTSILTAVVAALLYSGWEYHGRRGHFAELARLRAENERLRHGGAAIETKIASARDATSRPQPAIPPGDSTADGPVSSPQANLHRPAPSTERVAPYRNEGRNTPVSALQTLAWACDSSDTATMETLIVFDDVARAKAAAYHASLPVDVRAQWSTLESLAAAVMIANGIRFPYPGAAVIDQAGKETVRPGRVVLLLPGTRYDRVEFQQYPDGWKRVITEAMVDDYLAELSQPR